MANIQLFEYPKREQDPSGKRVRLTLSSLEPFIFSLLHTIEFQLLLGSSSSVIRPHIAYSQELGGVYYVTVSSSQHNASVLDATPKCVSDAIACLKGASGKLCISVKVSRRNAEVSRWMSVFKSQPDRIPLLQWSVHCHVAAGSDVSTARLGEIPPPDPSEIRQLFSFLLESAYKTIDLNEVDELRRSELVFECSVRSDS